MMERRTLLALLAASAFVPAAACSAAVRRPVVIVGAGMAGLAAAVDLRAAGHEVVIVEARARSGGRIHTSRLWPGLPMDMGASWIHHIDGNPVTDLARSAGAEFATTSYESSRLYIDPALAALGVMDGGEADAERLVGRAIGWAGQQPADVSLQSAIDAVAPATTLDAARRAQLNFYLAGAYEQEFAASTAHLSMRSLDDGEEFDGEDALFPNGYGQIIDHLARGMDIRMNQKVTGVRMTRDGATVSLRDGSVLEAGHVLITVPLGVLKTGDIAFDPPLPADKREAIDRLGMGLLNKHWLRFDRPHWDTSVDWHERLTEAKGEWSEWVSLAKLNDTPALLVFSAADHAERVEQMDDAAIVSSIMGAARTMFGSALPDPQAVQISRWRADPFACGAYSFHAVGSGPEQRRILARSEHGRLHFAGEAQNDRYPSTVHGALLSGRAAARAIIGEIDGHG